MRALRDEGLDVVQHGHNLTNKLLPTPSFRLKAGRTILHPGGDGVKQGGRGPYLINYLISELQHQTAFSSFSDLIGRDSSRSWPSVSRSSCCLLDVGHYKLIKAKALG